MVVLGFGKKPTENQHRQYNTTTIMAIKVL
jgi:hypothetical protein